MLRTRRDLLRLAVAAPMTGAGLLPVAVAGQAASFEVASVSPFVAPDDPSLFRPILVTKSRIELRGFTTLMLIAIAYRAKQSHEVEEGKWSKTWAGTDRLTIQAKIPENATPKQGPEMLQTLLAERFALATHREPKVMPAYVLTVAKGGPKFQRSTSETEDPTAAFRGEEPRLSMIRGGMRVEHERMTMAMLASRLSQTVDRPVVDLTDLHGQYAISLDLMRDVPIETSDGPGLTPSGSGYAISSGLGTLGLKLEARKVPCEVLVIDHLERPTGN